jgi:excisionase family DNA binding protein
MKGVTFSPLEPELLSIRKLAQVLDCSPKTVQDWLYKERKRPGSDPLPYYKLGGLVRFRIKEVMAWVDRRQVRISSVALR